MKKSLVYLLTSIVLVTVTFIVLGVLFNKDENQKQEGMSDIYAVSPEGEVAYITFRKGQASILLQGGKEIIQLPVERTIADMTFSKDGKSLAYIERFKVPENQMDSEIHMIDLGSLEDQVVYTSDNLLTEIAFDPKNSETLFFIQAGIFTNYSPIASEQPHEFDVHSYDMNKKQHTKHTDYKKYSMGSLQVSNEKDSVYVQMDDDQYSETPEEIFATSQRIFEIPLTAPDEKSIVSSPVQEGDIYDFMLLPEKQTIIYQAVAGTGENGNYEYELFTFNWKTYKTEQLTTLKESASRPVLGPDDKIYFMVDREFGSRFPDYHLYRINQDGSGVEEVLTESN